MEVNEKLTNIDNIINDKLSKKDSFKIGSLTNNMSKIFVEDGTVELKTVTLKHGEIINIGRLNYPKDKDGNEMIPEGITFEEREMKYTILHGWQELDFEPPLSDEENIQNLKEENEELKMRVSFAEDALLAIMMKE